MEPAHTVTHFMIRTCMLAPPDLHQEPTMTRTLCLTAYRTHLLPLYLSQSLSSNPRTPLSLSNPTAREGVVVAGVELAMALAETADGDAAVAHENVAEDEAEAEVAVAVAVAARETVGVLTWLIILTHTVHSQVAHSLRRRPPSHMRPDSILETQHTQRLITQRLCHRKTDGGTSSTPPGARETSASSTSSRSFNRILTPGSLLSSVSTLGTPSRCNTQVTSSTVWATQQPGIRRVATSGRMVNTVITRLMLLATAMAKSNASRRSVFRGMKISCSHYLLLFIPS